MNNEEAISELAYELREGRAVNELTFETLDGFNPVLNSDISRKNVDESNAFYGFVFDFLFEIQRNLEILKDNLIGNKLQDEENRRELIDVLRSLRENGLPANDSRVGPPPLPNEDNDSPLKTGFFAGLGATIGSLIPSSLKAAFAPTLAMFGSFTKFITKFLSFGKAIIKFAGPIGIAISIITGLIGAIKGGLAGYEEDGIIGAIKGAIIGAIDMLLKSIVDVLADIATWLFSALGMEESAAMLKGSIGKWFDALYKNISGIVDIIAGLFTLDPERFIKGFSQMFDAINETWKIMPKILSTLVKEAIPVIWKFIKFQMVEIPKFIGSLLVSLFQYIADSWPAFKDKLMNFINVVSSKLFEKIMIEGNKLKEFLPKKILEISDSIMSWFSNLLSFSNDSEDGEKESFISKIYNKTKDFIENIIDSIIDIFKDPKAALGSIMSGGASMMEEVYKKILKAFLPDRNASKTSAAGIASMLIPDFIYDFAESPTKRNDSAVAVGKSVGLSGNLVKPSRAAQREIQGVPSSAGKTLVESSTSTMIAPVIINQTGGNVTNMNTSNVSNNTSSFDPIIAGSALGFSNF